MDDKMMIALTKFLESGGTLALWGILIWQGLAYLKVLTVAFFVFSCVWLMSKTVIKARVK